MAVFQLRNKWRFWLLLHLREHQVLFLWLEISLKKEDLNGRETSTFDLSFYWWIG
jgi:hypothetical protein